MKPWIWIALGILLLGIVLLFVFKSRGWIEPERAHALVDQGALLIDVRSPAEYKQGHIEGAKNIPISEAGERLKEFGAQDKPVVLYCRSGTRSGQVAGLLEKNGFTQVHNLGPMTRW